MRILFDTGIPRALAKSLNPHQVSTTQKQGWKDLRNGDLLRIAQESFDVLITTDSNVKYQQRIEQFDIALIVLRAVKISKDKLLPLVPDILATLPTIKPGECLYLYADEILKDKDSRKGQPRA
jgi:predicted nuclease of predicted toxin-antitoxin system